MQGKMATNATTEITAHRFHIATASKLTEWVSKLVIFIGKCVVVRVLSPPTTCARTAPSHYDLVNHFGCYHKWLFLKIFLGFSQCKWCTKTQFIAATHPPTTPCSFLIYKWSELVWIKSLEVHNKIYELFNPLISYHHFVKPSNHWLYIIMCHGLYEMLVFNAPYITHTSIANASSSTFPAWLTILTHPLLFLQPLPLPALNHEGAAPPLNIIITRLCLSLAGSRHCVLPLFPISRKLPTLVLCQALIVVVVVVVFFIGGI